MPSRSSPTHDAVLAQWTVGLLRVDGARSALSRAVADAGARVVVLPTLRLRAAPDPGAVREQLASLADAAWVFVSPAAVRFAWRVAPQFAPASGARVFAVGPSTAAALARRGVAALHPAERHDSEGLLAMPGLDSLRGKVALVKAPGGRALLAESLRARGLEVHEVEPYRRDPARWDRRHVARLDAVLGAAPRGMLVASSAESLGTFVRLAGLCLAEVTRAPLIVSSARLAAHAGTLGFGDVHVASGATTAPLLAAIIELARACAALERAT